ncbi:MAG: dockerin type I domain-containing protein [Oscillospiraceae bacterium]|nr:dockerin type I domain-containing protein [Oscillospiraceae bacterium]
MKKLMILVLAITIMLTLFACSATNTEPDDTTITNEADAMIGNSAEPQIVRAPTGSMRIEYLTFEQALLVSTDIVIANYVGSRPFGETLVEFEFVVLDRILGNAAGTIFVYAENAYASVMGVMGASSYNPSESTFSSGTDYLLVLDRLWRAVALTHPDGYLFINGLIIDLDNPAGSTMYNEPVSHHATEINFNSRSLDREELIAFITEKTANNPPGRDHIRSDNIVDIIAGSPCVLIVEIGEPRSLASAQSPSDWVESDRYYVTVVEVLKGDVDVGVELIISFFADTVQTGERHIVAVARLEEGSTTFSFTSRNSLYRLDQRDEIMGILAGQGSSTLTFHAYGEGTFANGATSIAIPVTFGEPLDLSAVTAYIDAVDEQGQFAFWGWFTDAQLDGSGRSRNGHRRPLLSDDSIAVPVSFTQAAFEALAVGGNIDLYAIWSLWGDVDDDGVVTPIDASMLMRFVSGLAPRPVINLAAADVVRDSVVNPIDANVLMRYVSGMAPRPVLGQRPPTEGPQQARGDDADEAIWRISHEEVSPTASHVDVRVYLHQNTPQGMGLTIFTIGYDPAVLTNPRTTLSYYHGGLDFDYILHPGHIHGQNIILLTWSNVDGPYMGSDIFVYIRFDIASAAAAGDEGFVRFNTGTIQYMDHAAGGGSNPLSLENGSVRIVAR